MSEKPSFLLDDGFGFYFPFSDPLSPYSSPEELESWRSGDSLGGLLEEIAEEACADALRAGSLPEGKFCDITSFLPGNLEELIRERIELAGEPGAVLRLGSEGEEGNDFFCFFYLVESPEKFSLRAAWANKNAAS